AFDPTYHDALYDPTDAVVVKLNPGATSLAYSTYLGSMGNDDGNALAVASDGTAYVAGSTDGADFPTTPGAFDTTFAPGCCIGNGFVSHLNSSGSGLVASTFLGSSTTEVYGLAVNSDGTVFVAGWTD